jgi:hypothetical protein
MGYVLRYRANRQDVWSWYWRRWRNGAWLRQLLIALAISVYGAFSNHLSISVSLLLLAAAFLIVTMVFAAWPQVAFKPQERVLSVNSAGWSTQIEKKSGAKSWSEIESLRADHDVVVITSRDGNALLVPPTAFTGPDEQGKFVRDAQAWHNGHAV